MSAPLTPYCVQSPYLSILHGRETLGDQMLEDERVLARRQMVSLLDSDPEKIKKDMEIFAKYDIMDVGGPVPEGLGSREKCVLLLRNHCATLHSQLKVLNSETDLRLLAKGWYTGGRPSKLYVAVVGKSKGYGPIAPGPPPPALAPELGLTAFSACPRHAGPIGRDCSCTTVLAVTRKGGMILINNSGEDAADVMPLTEKGSMLLASSKTPMIRIDAEQREVLQKCALPFVQKFVVRARRCRTRTWGPRTPGRLTRNIPTTHNRPW